MTCWRRLEITLDCKEGPFQVIASVRQGLALHRTPGRHRGWTVSHVVSGRSILPTGLPKLQAFAYAEALLKIGEWDRPTEQVLKLAGRVAEVRAQVFA